MELKMEGFLYQSCNIMNNMTKFHPKKLTMTLYLTMTLHYVDCHVYDSAFVCLNAIKRKSFIFVFLNSMYYR